MDLLKEVVNTFINAIFGSEVLQKAYDIIVMSPASSSVNMVNTIVDISKDAAIPIASVLLCIYFIMDLSDQVTTDRFNSDQFMKMLIKLAFGQFLITNATGFALQFMNIGVSFMSAIAESTSTSMKYLTIQADGFTGFLVLLGLIIGLFLPYVITVVLQISIFMMCYTRLFEMTIRAMIAPIGVADIMHGGTNSQGFRYLKKCLAIALQGGLMLIVLLISSNIQSSIISGLVGGGTSGQIAIISVDTWATFIGVLGATTGTLALTKTLANEVVGA